MRKVGRTAILQSLSFDRLNINCLPPLLANFYLENMIELVNEDLDSRIIQYLNQSPENGEWKIKNEYLSVPAKLDFDIFPL